MFKLNSIFKVGDIVTSAPDSFEVRKNIPITGKVFSILTRKSDGKNIVIVMDKNNCLRAGRFEHDYVLLERPNASGMDGAAEEYEYIMAIQDTEI